MIKYAIIGTALVIGTFIFMSCNASKKTQTEAKTCTPLLIDRDLYTKGVKSDESLIRVNSATIDGDCLTIEVESTICKNKLVDYQLVWNEISMKSMPPQVNILLFADNQEKCETPQKLTLKYDLKPLQSANPRGEVILRLRGHSERLNYSFSSNK